MEFNFKMISELGRVVTGKTPPTENADFFDGNYPFITPSDIHTYDEKYLAETERSISESGAKKLKGLCLPPRSICFVCIGSTIGKMCMTNKHAFSNQQINSLIPSKEYDFDYVFYFLRYIRSYFQSIGGGTGSGKGIVNKTLFSKTKINILKDKTNQQRIGAILSAYDNLIEVNNKRIKVLEQMAENLYKEWFVRFRFPGHETAEFENGIPKGWKYRRFSDLYNTVRGISYSSDEIDCVDGEPLINLKNIQGYGGFRIDGTKQYKGQFKPEQRVIQKDLVMGVTDMTQDRRTVGAVALIPKLNGVISADLVKLVSSLNNVFSYCMFRWGFYSSYISQFGNGANVIHLKPGSIKNAKMLIPNNRIMDGFVKITEPIIDQIDILNEKNDILIQQRDLLLPRLMSGKLEV